MCNPFLSGRVVLKSIHIRHFPHMTFKPAILQHKGAARRVHRLAIAADVALLAAARLLPTSYRRIGAAARLAAIVVTVVVAGNIADKVELFIRRRQDNFATAQHSRFDIGRFAGKIAGVPAADGRLGRHFGNNCGPIVVVFGVQRDEALRPLQRRF